MIGLVTLTQVKERLRVDITEDDANLQGLIKGASRMVLNYLGLVEADYYNSDGGFSLDSETLSYNEVPPEVQVATIFLVGVLYRDPDGKESKDWQQGYLPMPVISMLYPLRDPTIR